MLHLDRALAPGRVGLSQGITPRPPVFGVLDAMIARAEAACERCRREASNPHLLPFVVARRKAAQHKAEMTLARLRRQRADAVER